MARSNPPAPGWRYDRRSHGWYDASEYSSYNEAKTSARNLGFRNSGLEYGWLSDYKARKMRAATPPPDNIIDFRPPFDAITPPEKHGNWTIQRSRSLDALVRMMTVEHPRTDEFYFGAQGRVIPNYLSLIAGEADESTLYWRSLFVAQANHLSYERLYKECADAAAVMFVSIEQWEVIWRRG